LKTSCDSTRVERLRILNLSSMHNYDVIIAGAGPAGCAAALQLHKLDPYLVSRVLLLDKAIFPRPKLCAGAVSPSGESVLNSFGVDFDFPVVPIHLTRFVLPTGVLAFQKLNQLRIVRREQLDHHLFRAAHNCGITTREGEAVQDVARTSDSVIVQTSRNEYRTKILIAADGANSVVRTRLGLSRVGRIMVGLEIHAPLADASIPDFVDNTIVVDFAPLSHDLPGYCWIFPTAYEKSSIISLGIAAAPFGREDANSVKTVFGRWLRKLGLDLNAFDLKAHPALRYEPKAACHQDRVLFVGDAAGVEPLFGEGISSAVILGTIAARAGFDSLRTHDFSFADYENQIRASSIGSMLRRRQMIARRLYMKPRLAQLYFQQKAFFRGIALLSAAYPGAKVTWQPRPSD
jgi:menaquinone-9 beta-reductase